MNSLLCLYMYVPFLSFTVSADECSCSMYLLRVWAVPRLLCFSVNLLSSNSVLIKYNI